MPLKVRRLWVSSLILGAATGAATTTLAQQPTQNQPSNGAANAASAAANPTNLTQQKIARVRALIAARNFGSAASELDKLRRENPDEALQTVTRTMLVAVYLEQPDYARAASLLEDSFKRNKNRKTGMDGSYLAVAGQIIKGAQNQLERYKRIGLNIADANLPKEAASDLDKWRAMLETVINQAKQMSVENKKPAEALALLEEAANTRGALSRDEYETARWKNEMNDTREMMANAQMKISEVDENLQQTPLVAVSLPVNPPAPAQNTAASVNALFTAETPEPKSAAPQAASGQNSEALNQIAAANLPENKLEQDTVKQDEPAASAPVAEIAAANPATQAPQTIGRQRLVAANTAAQKPAENVSKPAIEKTTAAANSSNEPMAVGSLVDMATRKVNPTYPPVAKTARITGIVKVEVVLDEQGAVAEVRTANGPEMLRRAATDAVKRWKFKPMTRDGQPVRASGFVNFNFTL